MSYNERKRRKVEHKIIKLGEEEYGGKFTGT